jgi:hypothetical protein
METSRYFAKNTDARTFNRNILARIIATVTHELGRNLTKEEVDAVKNNLGNYPAERVSIEDLVKNVASMSAKKITEMNLKRKKIDVHDLQMKLISEEQNSQSSNPISQVLSTFNPKVDIGAILGINSSRDLVSLIAPQTARKSAFIVLDSRFRTFDTDGVSVFRWNMSNSQVATSGTVNNVNSIRNLNKIRVNPLRIPYSSTSDTYYKRISMTIVEFSSQAAILHENGFAHFWFKPIRDGNFIELETDYQNDGVMEFATPISKIDTLTIRFGNPTQTVFFNNDRQNAIIYQYGTETIIRVLQPHNLSTGDLVIFSDFTTQNANGDYVIINSINTDAGINIDVSGALANPLTDFSINIDTSTLAATGTGTVNVTINSTTVVGVSTNFYSFFRAGDIIVLSGNKYTIASVDSNTILKLKTQYGGITATGLAYSKNNTVSDMQILCYFASQRFFIPLTLEYTDANIV